MPAGFTARLLGELEFAFDGRPLAPGGQVTLSRKGGALLAFLAVERRAVSREELAALLWAPGRLASVRQELYQLRRLPGADDWLAEEDGALRLLATSDLDELAAALDAGDVAALDGLEGELLGSLGTGISPAFDDWLEQERDELTRHRADGLRAAATRLERDGWPARALEVVERALALDPLSERLYRDAMRLNHSLGERDAALEAYRRCREALRDELGVAPAPETSELAAAIERTASGAGAGGALGRAFVTTLPEGQLRLLQLLGIAAGDLDLSELAELLERPALELADDLAVLERRGLVDGRLQLNLALAAEVRASVTEPLARLLHGRVAAALARSAGADDALVARHWLAAGEPRTAAPLYLSAGRAAVESSRLDDATRHLFRAIWSAAAACDASPNRHPREDDADPAALRITACFLLEGLAGQRGDDALQESALSEAERLAWEAQRDPQLAEARLRRARLLLRRGQVGEGLERALESLEISLRVGDQVLAARARNAVGAAHFYAGDLAGAAEAFEATLETTDPVERYRAHSNLGALAAMRGRLPDSYEHFDRALTLARELGQQVDVAATLNNLAATAERMGDYRRAVRHFREGIDLAGRHQAGAREGQLLLNLAVVYAKQGELGPSWNTALEVEEMAELLADRRLAMLTHEQKGEVARLCGALEVTQDELRRAVELARELGDERKLPALETQLAVVRAALDPRLAPAALDAVERLAQAGQVDVLPWLWLELALWATDAAVALERLRRAEEAGLRSAHQRLLHEVALLRAALLPTPSGDEGDAVRAELTRLADELIARLDDPTKAPDLEVAERPKLRLYRHLHGLRRRGVRDVAAEPLPPEIVAELEEQGAGLPRRLRESLLAVPARWLAPVAPVGPAAGAERPMSNGD